MPDYTLVQHTSKDAASATSTTISFGGATTVGNLIIAGVRVGGTSTAAFTDDKSGGSNNYASGASIQSSSIGLAHTGLGTCYIFAVLGATGASTTLTCTLTGGAATMRICIAEFSSSLGTTWTLDKTSSNYTTFDTSSPHDSGTTATTTQASELLIGFSGNNSAGTYTAGTSSSWVISDVAPAGASARACMEYVAVTSTGTYKADFTCGAWPSGSGTGDSVELIATYMASSSAAGQPAAARMGGVPFAHQVGGAQGGAASLWRKMGNLVLPERRRVIVPGFSFAGAA